MLNDALNGMGEPWFIVTALILTTFLLEHVAIVWVVIAVVVWTASLFWISATTGHALAQLLGVPESVAVTLPIIAIALAFPAYKYFKQRKKTSNPSTKNE
jgi:hypothetical protein